MTESGPVSADAIDRFAVFSDVHGSILSLERVWRDITAAGLDRFPVLNGGDNVAYGKYSDQCVHFLMANSRIISVQGNYDRHAAEYPENDDEIRKKWGAKRPDKYHAIKAAGLQLEQSQKAWLEDLPVEVRLSMNGRRIVLCHYVPGSKKEGLHAATSKARLSEIARTVAADVVVVGHTHSAFVDVVDDVLFVNPGSVGRNWGRPTWAVVHVTTGLPAAGEIMTCV